MHHSIGFDKPIEKKTMNVRLLDGILVRLNERIKISNLSSYICKQSINTNKTLFNHSFSYCLYQFEKIQIIPDNCHI